MLKDIRPAIVSTVLLTVLLGIGYPLLVTGIAKLAFPWQADGSLVRDTATGRLIGSALIAQPFARAEYLHPRPSAAGNGYDATSSGGSNLGPLNPDLTTRIVKDAAALRASTGKAEVPDDAVTTSGSGLDPDISPTYAYLQVDRIAKARGATPAAVRAIVAAHVQGPDLGFLGQPRVNVLMTNRALDAAVPKAQPRPS
ncbi:MAG: potassium-transporting ATPase subunit KdpC [Caulobacteraceae bacterium]|jgi:K+-transporting ATPase ATPase C chain